MASFHLWHWNISTHNMRLRLPKQTHINIFHGEHERNDKKLPVPNWFHKMPSNIWDQMSHNNVNNSNSICWPPSTKVHHPTKHATNNHFFEGKRRQQKHIPCFQQRWKWNMDKETINQFYRESRAMTKVSSCGIAWRDRMCRRYHLRVAVKPLSETSPNYVAWMFFKQLVGYPLSKYGSRIPYVAQELEQMEPHTIYHQFTNL